MPRMKCMHHPPMCARSHPFGAVPHRSAPRGRKHDFKDAERFESEFTSANYRPVADFPGGTYPVWNAISFSP